MSEKTSPLAGKPAPKSLLVDIGKLLDAYADRRPDPSVPSQRVAFGTSGHRGSSLECSFNEWHILAITQAICDFRAKEKITGPLFLGIDTHALSQPASDTALEVLAANGVTTLIAKGGEFTPTPAVSHAILVHNRGRTSGLADGIVVTPSHNPPDNGGFKYNPVNGGPADTTITSWIEQRANDYLEKQLQGVKRAGTGHARRADTTREHDYLDAYVSDLRNAIDFDVIRESGLHFGVDPLGGAGVHYWAPIAERYSIDLSVISETVDPQFAFMTVDWDGQIRMDPSSKYAMQRLIGLKDRYDVAFACDTDHDRHGVVARSAGLMLPNSYLSVAIAYLFGHRPQWPRHAKLGKTVVSTSLLDRVARRTGRELYETPVGFKWFADGLFDGSLGFGCEESAGASFLRRDGTVWTTDKDGIVAALLAAEMTARAQRDPGELYQALTRELGTPLSNRVDAKATPAQKKKLSKLSRDEIRLDRIAGEKIERVLDRAPGNDAPIGGIKVIAKSGWFAARPSGTEDIYKIYAESFRDESHLQALLEEAQDVVDKAIA
ncbi:MAG TPA: phosphoglucomutase (alpha-D-glucose-1,6-bisphosphate-dependent) [Rhodanobacteraceae bacterium]|nr:phosphoglucomutase (alpha-D-glucose-1,6-bisphosphate-dependent) [Rhodanobacteraceae bacterium]